MRTAAALTLAVAPGLNPLAYGFDVSLVDGATTVLDTGLPAGGCTFRRPVPAGSSTRRIRSGCTRTGKVPRIEGLRMKRIPLCRSGWEVTRWLTAAR